MSELFTISIRLTDGELDDLKSLHAVTEDELGVSLPRHSIIKMALKRGLSELMVENTVKNEPKS